MFKKIVLFWGSLVISLGIWAQDTKIIGFDQVFNLGTEKHYELELEGLNPSSQLWTAFYLVGEAKAASANTQLDFIVLGDGLLEKNHPTQPGEQMTLVAQDLQIRKKYSFKEFDELSDEIEDQTGKKVQDPYLANTNNIRVYGKILDWIPEYNLNKPAKVIFGVENAKDFEIKAAYLVVGEGEKTPQLLKLNIQPHSASMQPDFNSPDQRAEHNLARFEAKFLIFLTIAAGAIFLNWGKWRRE